MLKGSHLEKNGKTDICIEYDNRAAFIAECKFWGGEKVLKSAIEQLYNYTTWRDNKICLIMFSTNKDFFNVLSEIKKCVEKLDNFENIIEKDKNEFEYRFHSKNTNQIIIVRIYAFDLSI